MKKLIKLSGIFLISISLNANDISLFKVSEWSLNYVSIENNTKDLVDIDINGKTTKLISGTSMGILCNQNEIVSFNSMMYITNQFNMIDIKCGNKILITENKYEN